MNDETRDCERCGRARPTSPDRFALVASDFTDGTADFEKFLLCKSCWRNEIDDLRRAIA